MSGLPIAMVGCGGMGGRHLFGLCELRHSNLSPIDLVAVCDVREDNAEHLASNAEEILGYRPQVFSDMQEMAEKVPDLAGITLTTDAGSHHLLAPMALHLGLNVLCEKPMALTIRGCNRIIQAMEKSGRVLSVAENIRRDPLVRLTKALLDARVVGDPYLLLSVTCGGSNRIFITPWRHNKNIGGILIDLCVHNADLMQYYMGDVREVSGQARLYEAIRFKPESETQVTDPYRRWYEEMPEQVQATAEDALFGVLTFDGGVSGQWTSFHAAHGQGFGHTVIYGSKGSLIPGKSRAGQGPIVHLDERGEVTGEAVLDLVPDFRLDEVTARLFGADRLSSYEMSFPEADRKLLAFEYDEFARCIESGCAPEVDARWGRRAIAPIYGVLESSLLCRPVQISDITEEALHGYEERIDAHLGL